MAALTLERQHRIDHMFEHARPRYRPVLGDMADEHDRGIAVLGIADQLLRARADLAHRPRRAVDISEEHTSELQSLMRISYSVFCLKKTKALYFQTTYRITVTHKYK